MELRGKTMSIFDFFKRKKQGKQAIEPSPMKTEDPDEIITSLKEQKLSVSEEQAMHVKSILMRNRRLAAALMTPPPDKTPAPSAENTTVPDAPLKPPEFLWLTLDPDGDIPYEAIDGKQCLRLFEKPEDAAKEPNGPLGRVLLCEMPTEQIRDSHACDSLGDGVWLVEGFDFSNVPPHKSRTKALIKAYVSIRMLLAEPEWFEDVRRICEEWQVRLGIPRDSLQGLRSVEYMWSKGGPPRKKPLFLVSQFGEDDYIFSDKRHFFYARIVNPWEWDPWMDKIEWKAFKKLEYLIPRHCCRHGSRVPLDYLGMALSYYIANKRPTFERTWFMWSEEKDYHGTVYLIAHYAVQENGAVAGVEAIELCVKSSRDDPDALVQTMIRGSGEEICDWMRQPENEQKIAAMARDMLQAYEPIYLAKAQTTESTEPS